MATEELIATLRQIRALADAAIAAHTGPTHKTKKPSLREVEQAVKQTNLSFNTNLLAFMKQHARGLPGPNKFTLLLARLAKGNVSQEVPLSELERQWNKMKVIVGGKFNNAYANRAKGNGWIDAPKHGSYTLSDSWKEAIKRTNG